MIGTVVMTSLRRLAHNRGELALAWLVPIAFFSIFALIFGNLGSGQTASIKAVVVDLADTPASGRLIAQLNRSAGLRLVDFTGQADSSDTAAAWTTTDGDETTAVPRPVSQGRAVRAVRRGLVSLAIVIQNDDSGRLRADLLADASDQVAPQLAVAIVSQSLAAAAPLGPIDARGQAGVGRVVQAAAVDPWGPDRPAPVQVIDLLGDPKSNPVVTMYAAGIAVMFLLFGASSGGATLLEEREQGTLDRLLTSGVTMDQVLLGKWCYLTLMGTAQTTLMFLWGQMVFQVDLWGHLGGFLLITLVTAGAAASLGLMLATLCRTRSQLGALSVVVVLAMSALGGSMVPRYVMSQSLQDLGRWTFNAWALDGYDKLFWRDLPPAELWPQLAVLMTCGALCLVAARGLAIRWESE